MTGLASTRVPAAGSGCSRCASAPRRSAAAATSDLAPRVGRSSQCSYLWEGSASMSDAGLRILVVDDHPLVRRGMRAMLGVVAGFEIVGEARTGREAVALAM